MSNARWELIEPVLAAWRTERHAHALHIGRPPEHDLRAILNAIVYVDRTGIPWRYLPHDYPQWATVYGYFRAWRQEGFFTRLLGLLRRLVRVQEGHNADASACVIDAHSVKTSTNVPVRDQGIDAAKQDRRPQTQHRGRHLGLLLAVLVTAASVQDSVAGTTLIYQISADHPVSVRAGGRRLPSAPGRTRRHPRHQHGDHSEHPGTRGFTPLHRRWVAERTLGWLMLHRRLAATTRPCRPVPKP